MTVCAVLLGYGCRGGRRLALRDCQAIAQGRHVRLRTKGSCQPLGTYHEHVTKSSRMSISLGMSRRATTLADRPVRYVSARRE